MSVRSFLTTITINFWKLIASCSSAIWWPDQPQMVYKYNVFIWAFLWHKVGGVILLWAWHTIKIYREPVVYSIPGKFLMNLARSNSMVIMTLYSRLIMWAAIFNTATDFDKITKLECFTVLCALLPGIRHPWILWARKNYRSDSIIPLQKCSPQCIGHHSYHPIYLRD